MKMKTQPYKIYGMPTHWRLKLGPGVSAGLLTSRARSWSLVAGPRHPRADITWLGVRQGRGADPDTVRYRVWGVLKLLLAC